MIRIQYIVTIGLMMVLPMLVEASPTIVPIKTGIPTSVTVISVLKGIVNVLLYWGGGLSTAVFMLGAFVMAGSTGNDEYVSMGKTMMKSAAIGLALLLASWMILSTVVFFIYG